VNPMLRIGQFIGPIYKWLPKSSSSYDTELAQKLPQICLYIHLYRRNQSNKIN
jgi:hypothetical protein